MADTYEDFQRDDWQMEQARDHREELEREDIMSIAVNPWRRAMRIAAQTEEEAA